MRDVDMTATADDGLPLAGTLTLPAGPGPHPAVLLLHGSGPLDRDANTRTAPHGARAHHWPPRSRRRASPHCATTGAASAPHPATGARPDSSTTASDAAAALRALAERPTSGRTPSVWSGTARAPSTPCPSVRIRGCARWCCWPGSPALGEDALRWQAGMIARDSLRRDRAAGPASPGRPAAGPDQDDRHGRGARRRYAGERPVDAGDAHPRLAPGPDEHPGPVLAITGGKDVQVDPADLDGIRQAGARRGRGPPDPADLTHLLRRDPGRPSVRSYPRLLRQPVDADLLAQVAGWLAHRLPAGK